MTRSEATPILEALSKQFMQPAITWDSWFEVEDTFGETHVVPSDCFDSDDYLPKNDKESVTVTFREAWGARLSAPGYMDCTEWALFDTEDEAAIYLAETYGDDIDLDLDELEQSETVDSLV